MASVGDLSAALARITSEVPFARLRTALETLDEIWAVLADEVAESNNDHLYAASESITRARDALAEAIDLIRAGTADLDEYRESIGLTPPPPDPTPAPPPSTPSQFLSELPEWTTRGQKVRGLWIDRDGQKHDLVSGQHDEWFHRATDLARELGLVSPAHSLDTTSHVELKFAAMMRHNGLTKEVIMINKPPCPGQLGCDTLLPEFLPPDSELTVHGPNGFTRTYRGVR